MNRNNTATEKRYTFMYLRKYQNGVSRIRLFNILPPKVKSLNNDTNAFIPALKAVSSEHKYSELQNLSYYKNMQELRDGS